MAVSVIDGTLEAVTVKGRTAKVWRLNDLAIRKADGALEMLKGMTVATREIGEALQPGLTGRFYLYKSIDHRGLHAIRPSGGQLLHRFPATNENLMAVLFFINLAVLGGMTALNGQPYLLNIALVPFTAVLYVLYRRTRMQAEAQVNADNPAA